MRGQKSFVVVMLIMIGALGFALWQFSSRFLSKASAGPVTLFDIGWNFRKAVSLSYQTNGVNDLEEYQVVVSVDTLALINQGKLQNDCDDIRFIDENGTPLFYDFAEGSCGGAAKIFVKTEKIPTGGSSIYMYYGNPSAEPEYRKRNNVFSYKDARAIGYALNDSAVALDIVSLANENMIIVKEQRKSFSKGSAITLPYPYFISASKPIGVDDSGNSASAPIAWAGTEFVTPTAQGDTVDFLLIAPFGNASAEIQNSSSCSGSFTVGKTAVRKNSCIQGGSVDLRIVSTNSFPILAAFKAGGSSEYRILYPETGEELYEISDLSHVGGGNNFAAPLPLEFFGTQFGSNAKTEYVGVISNQSAVCILKDEAPGDSVQTAGAAPVFFQDIQGEWTMECDRPVYAISKHEGAVAAKNLWTETFMRQLSYPFVSVSALQSEETRPSSPPGIVLPENPIVSCPDTYVPSNGNQYANASNRLGWWYNQEHNAGDEVISEYRYDVYLVPAQWFVDNSVAPNDAATWANPSFLQDHLVCFNQPHEVSYSQGGGVYVDIPQQCFPLDQLGEPLEDVSPTVGQLTYITLTKEQMTLFFYGIDGRDEDGNQVAASSLREFLEPVIENTKIFHGSGINFGDGAHGVIIMGGDIDRDGNMMLTVQDEVPVQTLIIPLEKPILENLIAFDLNFAQIVSDNLSRIKLTPFQLSDLYVNELTSAKLAFTAAQRTAWEDFQNRRTSAVSPDSDYYWRIGITIRDNEGDPHTALCPSAAPNSFHTIAVSEIKQSRAASEPTEQFIYDGRVIANPPPGFIDTFSDLPIFEQSAGR